MKIKCFFLSLCCILFPILIACDDEQTDDQGITETEINDTERPAALKGKLLYHSYTEYTTGDSEIYLYDFASNKIEHLSKNWNIRNPMNAHISPDGKRVVFMGQTNKSWDVFIYDLSKKSVPENLTAALGDDIRDEDPKFSPDGKKICFKHHWRIAEMDLETKKVTILTDWDYGIPYYNHDGSKIICTKGDAATSSIAVIDIQTKEVRTLYDTPGVQDYYPINANNESFFYSVGYATDNKIDQVYRGYWNGKKSVCLPFNNMDGDYSDAYPVTNTNWVVLCSTRTGSAGSYDLYIANTKTGKIYSMQDYNTNINTKKNELGPCYFEN